MVGKVKTWPLPGLGHFGQITLIYLLQFNKTEIIIKTHTSGFCNENQVNGYKEIKVASTY